MNTLISLILAFTFYGWFPILFKASPDCLKDFHFEGKFFGSNYSIGIYAYSQFTFAIFFIMNYYIVSVWFFLVLQYYFRWNILLRTQLSLKTMLDGTFKDSLLKFSKEAKIETRRWFYNHLLRFCTAIIFAVVAYRNSQTFKNNAGSFYSQLVLRLASLGYILTIWGVFLLTG